jgi:hypothetical protein
MDAFLQRTGRASATRRMLAGDASFRRYERVDHDNKIMVLMDAPPPWEQVGPFIAVTRLLEKAGVSVPTILDADEAEGFLLLEDLGDAILTRVLKSEPQREHELYAAACEALRTLQQQSPREHLPPYDEAVYLREVALFAEWFLPQIVGMEQARALRETWLEIWQRVLRATPLQQSVLVHRDYHADNLLWLNDREGHRAIGMLDYQDALWGDAAYDLVSLLEDARRDVSPATAQACYDAFAAHQNADFATRYAVLGAQRNAKIIGIFVRLCVRDGKAHYLDYLPRVWGHFLNDLQHPALAEVKLFVDAHVPIHWRGAFAADTAIGGIA